MEVLSTAGGRDPQHGLFDRGCDAQKDRAVRKAHGSKQFQLAEATDPAAIRLAEALYVTNDQRLGVKAPKVAPVEDDSEARRQWKRFPRITTLPKRNQKAVVRLINSLVAVTSIRRNGGTQGGERHGR